MLMHVPGSTNPCCSVAVCPSSPAIVCSVPNPFFSKDHYILVFGDGDFAFSLQLASMIGMHVALVAARSVPLPTDGKPHSQYPGGQCTGGSAVPVLSAPIFTQNNLGCGSSQYKGASPTALALRFYKKVELQRCRI